MSRLLLGQLQPHLGNNYSPQYCGYILFHFFSPPLPLSPTSSTLTCVHPEFLTLRATPISSSSTLPRPLVHSFLPLAVPHFCPFPIGHVPPTGVFFSASAPLPPTAPFHSATPHQLIFFLYLARSHPDLSSACFMMLITQQPSTLPTALSIATFIRVILRGITRCHRSY